MNNLFKFISVACVLVTVLGANAFDVEDDTNTPSEIVSTPDSTSANIIETADAKQKVLQLLESYTAGNDGFYNKVLSPAKSPNAQLSSADRIKRMNTKIAEELGAVLTAFDSAEELKKGAAALAVMRRFDPEITSEQSAHIEFIDGAPSAALSRTILLLNKKNLDAAKALDIFTSYKRSGKPSEYIYEYADANNLTSGPVKFTQGNDQTWIKPNAAAALPSEQNVAIKKCRQIFGWKCVTSLYRVNQSDSALRYVFMAGYDLSNNPDHADFAGDKRSQNQVAGSTALYIVRESAEQVLLIGIDAQWSQSSPSFTSLIQQEFQKDFRRLIQRFDLETK